MSAPVGGGEGGNDTELFSEVLRAQTKCFYIDVKENARGRYMKIAEKGRYRPKSSVVVPISGLPQFISAFRTYLEESAAGRLGANRDIIVESKVFSMSAGSNDRGQFLRVFESGGGFPSGGSSLMVPSGWQNAYWKMFYDALLKIARQLNEDGSLGPDPEGVLANVAPFDTGLGEGGRSDTAVLESKDGRPVLSVGNKHFFFEVGGNDRGQFLKVKEVSGGVKGLLVIPFNAIEKFQEAINAALCDPNQGGVSHGM